MPVLVDGVSCTVMRYLPLKSLDPAGATLAAASWASSAAIRAGAIQALTEPMVASFSAHRKAKLSSDSGKSGRKLRYPGTIEPGILPPSARLELYGNWWDLTPTPVTHEVSL